MFPKVPQSSWPESLGLKNPTMLELLNIDER